MGVFFLHLPKLLPLAKIVTPVIVVRPRAPSNCDKLRSELVLKRLTQETGGSEMQDKLDSTGMHWEEAQRERSSPALPLSLLQDPDRGLCSNVRGLPNKGKVMWG